MKPQTVSFKLASPVVAGAMAVSSPGGDDVPWRQEIFCDEVQAHDQTSGAVLNISTSENLSQRNWLAVTIPPDEKWDQQHASRFKKLLACYALGKLDSAGRTELRELQALRRRTELAPSPNELEFQWRRSKFLSDLRHLLEIHADIIPRSTREAWTAPKRKA